MARPLRIQYAGAFYHITSRGNERRPIFSSVRDREKMFSIFSEGVIRYGLSIHTYCLMENHYHLLLETKEANLSQAMHFINGGYTSYYNRVYHRSGHLFQGRYRAILVEKDQYVSTLSRYIHLNPVRAGLCKRPDGYRWSSYLGYLDPKKRPSWLETSLVLGYFSPRAGGARRKFKQFVEEGIRGEIPDPLEGVVSGIVLGTGEFIDRLKRDVIGRMRVGRDLPAVRQLKPRPSVEEIKRRVELSLGKGHRWLRDISIYLCQHYAGETLKRIGEVCGGMGESAVSQAIRRLVWRMEMDKKLKGEVLKIGTELRGLSTV